MSRLDKLIQELCPDGVEYKKIKDSHYRRLKGTPITAGKMKEIANEDGDVRVFAGGKTVINAFEDDIPNANITRVPAVLVQSRGVIDFVYYDKPFTFKNEMWAYTADDADSVKFLYYVLANNVEFFRGSASGMGSLPQISLPVTEEFEVPVPPLEIQREIVRVLDKFTLLRQELSAELSARKKQYEYYRDELLTFGDDVEWRELQEIFDIVDYRGKTPKKSEDGVFLVTAKNIRKGYIDYDVSQEFIPSETYEEVMHRGKPKIGDLLITTEAPCGYVALVDRNDIALAQRVIKYSAKDNDVIDMMFAKHYLLGNAFQTELARKSTGGTVKGIKGSKLHMMRIPVPPIDIQRSIAKILSDFDVLLHDIGSGLPAEINGRQYQYEYYRDKLLTFKRKETA